MLGAALPSGVTCIGAGYGQWGREPPIGVGKLPAPVACCLPRCWPAFARDRAGLVEAPGRSSVMRSAVVRAGARAVLQAKSCSRRGASPVGLVFGLFCMRSGVFKGMPSLCKCDNACEEWWRWESRAAVRDSPAAADADPGIAVKAAHGAERLGLCARGLRGTAGNWARCRSRIRGAGALQWAIAAEGTPVAGSR